MATITIKVPWPCKLTFLTQHLLHIPFLWPFVLLLPHSPETASAVSLPVLVPSLAHLMTLPGSKMTAISAETNVKTKLNSSLS